MNQALEVNRDILSSDGLNQKSYVLMTPPAMMEMDEEDSSASAEIEEKGLTPPTNLEIIKKNGSVI